VAATRARKRPPALPANALSGREMPAEGSISPAEVSPMIFMNSLRDQR